MTKKRSIQRRRNRRGRLQTGICAVVCVILIAPLLSACGATATPVPPTEAPAAQVAPTAVPATATPEIEAVAPLAASGGLEEQTLDIGYYAGPGADAHKRIGPDFADYTQGKVDITVEDIDRQTFDAKMTTAMQSGEEIWDVMVGLNLALKQMTEAGWLEPLDDYMADPELFNADLYNYEDFPEALRDLLSYDGKTYMIAQAPSVPMVFYRTDLLEKYGVDEPPEEGWSWTELREAAITVHEGLQADGETET
ncbi:MAG: extracellular solute-binding protein [Candidatus Eiseniibacteriota bacterium]|nr:MAG: extracellular solute-binding protein [Candidatus Eisenbacteria bacterium]